MLPDASQDTPEASSEPVYDPAHLLEIDLTLDEADWARIRQEGRSINQVFSGCDDGDFGYTFVKASARIDGQPFAELAVRKKGFLGSLSVARPSLRLDFARDGMAQRFRGQTELTLNNARQDPSLMRQCLAYRVFAAAGVPASRCSFAHVTVNSEDLGVYVSVEAIKKPMLRRYFTKDSGNLYELTGGADFRSDSLRLFEKKTNESDPSHEDLSAVTAALEASGAEMLAQLEPLIDLDEFMRFWAAETLVAHWDGYSGDLNNSYVYSDPVSGKLSFIPWGPDSAFQSTHPFLPSGTRPAVTYAWARLPNRLYDYGPMRERYHAALRDVLDQAWGEDELSAEIDRMVELLGDRPRQRAVDNLRSFVQARRAAVQAELDAPDVPWTIPERAPQTCNPSANVSVRLTFATTWGMLYTPAQDAGAKFELAADDVVVGDGPLLIGAGKYTDSSGSGGSAIRVIASHSDGSFLFVQLVLAAATLAPGELSMHGFETFGYVARGTSATDLDAYGYIGEGKLVLDEAGSEDGDSVKGHFEGQLVRISTNAQ